MNKGLIFTILLASVSALGFSQTTYTVRNAAGWIDAVNRVRSGGNNRAHYHCNWNYFRTPQCREYIRLRYRRNNNHRRQRHAVPVQQR